MKPGIINANLCAWGWEGIWKDRRGFDSLVQTATGLNHAEAQAYHEYTHPGEPLPSPLPPRPFPYQAFDYTSGYLLAFGIIKALCKSITEGGSWEVRVSLAGVAQYLRSLGRIALEIGFGEGKPLPPKLAPEMHPEVQALVTQWRVNQLVEVNWEDEGEERKKRRELVALRHLLC